MVDEDDAERRAVRAAQRGDRSAFDEIVLRHKASLYRFVRRYVGDADDAYDILQQTFIAAWLARGRFDSVQSLAAWLRTIALNKCRDFGRRRAARRRFMVLFAFELASPQSRTDDLTSDIDSRESRNLRWLDQAIAALPQRYKEPLLLTLVTGLSQRQAAEQLGTSPKAIEMRIRRAKEKLGQALSAWPEREFELHAEEFGTTVAIRVVADAGGGR